VVVTFADDPNRATLETFDRWLVTSSSWLDTVGSEYHVGHGSVLATIERTDRAPTASTTYYLEMMLGAAIDDGTLPSPGTNGDVIYVVHFPVTTSFNGGCSFEGGDHSSARSPMGTPYRYAVALACPPGGSPALVGAELATAHELIEVMTDPQPRESPAYAISHGSGGWSIYGGEVADLCSQRSEIAHENGYSLPLVWSNRAAATGTQDPCVPSTGSYFDVAITPGTERTVTGGQTLSFELAAWTTAAMAPFHLAVQTDGAWAVTTHLSATTMGNGDHATLEVTVPSSLTHSTQTVLYVAATEGLRTFHVTPIVLHAQ
jgi:hypothetical protein